MAQSERSSGGDSSTNPSQEEVVRLPVAEESLADRLEVMPVPGRVGRRQPEIDVDLMEEEVEDPIEIPLSQLGVGWEEEEGEGGQTPVGWLVLIGLILVALGGWALGKIAKGEATLSAEVERVEAGWSEQEQQHRAALALLTRVERLAKGYLEAETVDEKAKYVRQPERVKPLMEDYYGRHPLEPERFESIERIRPLAIEHRPFDFVMVNLAGDKAKMLCMEETPEGGLKFDWESEVAYQPMPLADYIEQKPTEPMDFRVYARLDNFPIHQEFLDLPGYSPGNDPEKEWLGLILRERDSDHFLFGYMPLWTLVEGAEPAGETEWKRNDPAWKLKERLEDNVRQLQAVFLRVRFLPDTQTRRSVLIEEVVAYRWVHIEPLAEPGAEETESVE